jgi:hypothetical protein
MVAGRGAEPPAWASGRAPQDAAHLDDTPSAHVLFGIRTRVGEAGLLSDSAAILRCIFEVEIELAPAE